MVDQRSAVPAPDELHPEAKDDKKKDDAEKQEKKKDEERRRRKRESPSTAGKDSNIRGRREGRTRGEEGMTKKVPEVKIDFSGDPVAPDRWFRWGG